MVRLAGVGALAISALCFLAAAVVAGKLGSLSPADVDRLFGPDATAAMFMEIGGVCVLLFIATGVILWRSRPQD